MSERIGFIGLGAMGRPMVNCLLRAGHSVGSFVHRRREAMEALKAKGLIEVSGTSELAKQTDIVMSIVVDEAQSDAVFRGGHGILEHLKPGSVIMLMSTISPEYCQQLAYEAREKHIQVLDCPVSGGTERAARGELSLICGGETETVERCRPTLEAMGHVHHCGAIGMGQIVKLANQALITSTFRLVSEARAMAEAHGMDLEQLMTVLRQATGNSFVVENWDLLSGQWAHLAPLASKDLNLFVAAAQKKDVNSTLIAEAARLMESPQ